MGSMVSRITEYTNTGIDELDMDILIEIASKLNPRDAAKIAMTCHRLKQAAYSYPVWESRELFLARHKLKFSDYTGLCADVEPTLLAREELFSQILLDGHKNVILAHGPNVLNFEFCDSALNSFTPLDCPNWRAQINCMRLYKVSGENGNGNKLLVTSGYDHKLRIWRENVCELTLKSCSGPSTALADVLRGVSGDSQILASGNHYGIVHLWSLSPNNSTTGKGDPIARLFTEDSQNVKDLAWAKHNSSLLVSLGKDSKLRVWDAQSETCVGCAGGPDGVPVGIRWGEAEAVCYVGCGSSVIGIDIRSMEVTGTFATHGPDLVAFQLQQYSSLICSGGTDKTAKLWDIRRGSNDVPMPITVLGNHWGPVKHIHMDSFKLVTGGHGDKHVHIWDANTADKLASLICVDRNYREFGLHGMAVKGTSIVTATCSTNFTSDGQRKIICFRDYSNSNCAIPL